MKYAILAHRSAMSVCGAADRLCKDENGKVIVFEKQEDADKQAKEYNDSCCSKNVWYETVEVVPGNRQWNYSLPPRT